MSVLPRALTPIYADDHLLVFDKPAGLLSVPGRGADKADCLSARAQSVHPDALIVHRLDMSTSGLIVMARGAQMQRLLSDAFAHREVRKHYVAVVAGHLKAPGTTDGWGEIDLPIAADWPNRPLRIVDRERGQASLTRWRVVAYDTATDTTRLELAPVTGRTHQLRVHLKAIGHPILGDGLYAPAALVQASPRLLLHASGLELPHPASGEPLVFSSPPPF